MRSSRLMSMLMLLQLRGPSTAPTLARELEVSVRTVYRDVDALSAAGVPIYADRGRLGGIALHPGYRAPPSTLSLGEARALPLVGLGGVAGDLGLGTEAASAQLKLLAGLPGASSADAQRVAECFPLDPLPWYHRRRIASLPARAGRRRVARAAGGHRLRRLEGHQPARAVTTGPGAEGRALVSRGTGRRSAADLSVSNIRRLEPLNTAFRRPRRFSLAQHWPSAVAEFEAGLIQGSARLRLSPEGLRILRAVNPAAAAKAEASQRPAQPKGWIEVDMPTEATSYAARQILRLGREAEVLKPQALRRAVAREARKVADLYGQRRR